MSVRLTFHGAARTVTGSCYLIEAGKTRVLIDCGMFQGTKTLKELNYRAFPFDPRRIDALILTHAHIDHAGLIPKLTKAGFDGPIYATPATVDLSAIMLPDSGHIQEMEVDQLNRRNRQRGRPEVTAIYSARDAEQALSSFRAVPYARWQDAAPGIRFRFWNAGHLLGSASVEVEATAGGETLRLLFSGDLGPDHKMLHPDPDAPRGFDVVVSESTYGGKERADMNDGSRREALAAVLREAQGRNGALIIPSFAVERTQELIVDLIALMDEGVISRAPVFMDSPLAAKASEVFEKHAREIEGGAALVRALNAPNVRVTESAEDSKAIARVGSFHIIVSASGMCEAGRVRHHLKNWLWRRQATVLLVGFQSEGTLGRLLLDGETRVRIMGDEVSVAARIRSIGAYSGHADASELDDWIMDRAPVTGAVFLVHGEQTSMDALAARLAGRTAKVETPELDSVWDVSREGARLLKAGTRRLAPEETRAPDVHNELSALMLDINAALDRAADRKAKSAIVRRLRRALDGS
jgi:metallo-beta-lactamase family protein